MLVSLGFFIAVLFAFVVAPAYWARAVRLTTQRLQQTLPINEAEIRADKDRLRTQYAMSIHKLARTVDAARISVARHKVEINKRDFRIGELERIIIELEKNVETKKNALHVFEQTILNRVPHIEKRLAQARDIISKRDTSISVLKNEIDNVNQALDKATELNLKKSLEIDLLKSSFASHHQRASRYRAHHYTIFKGDISLLQAELGSLRAKQQVSKISEQQEILRNNTKSYSRQVAVQYNDLSLNSQQFNTFEKYEHLAEFLSSLQKLNAKSQDNKEMEDLKSKLQSQEIEIEKLRASLKVFEGSKSGQNLMSIRDIFIVQKSRIASLEKEIKAQINIIRGLHIKLALVNDRSARQVAYHINQMCRLGVEMYREAMVGSQRLHILNISNQHRCKTSNIDNSIEENADTSIDLSSITERQCKSTPKVQTNLFTANSDSPFEMDDSKLLYQSVVDNRTEKRDPEEDAVTARLASI